MKHTFFKKWLALLLTVVMCIGLLPFGAMATVYPVEDDGTSSDYARLAVNFKVYTGGEDTDIDIATMYVKKKDTQDEEQFKKALYDPGIGDVNDDHPDWVFKGWTAKKNYTAEDVSDILDIDGVRTAVKGMTWAEGDSTDYYAALFKHYTITYVDNDGVVVGTDTAELPIWKDDVSYTINQGYSTDDTHNFEGWIPAEGAAGADNIDGYPGNAISEKIDGETINYYENNTEVTITGDVTFEVNQPSGCWLIFDENGKGGTYNAPQFVKADDVTRKPIEDDQMTRYGYTFGGWYNTADCVEGDEFEFEQPLTKKTTIYAYWIEKDTAPYTIIFWTQNLNRTGYEVAGSYVGTGDVHQNIPIERVPNGAEPYATGDFDSPKNDVKVWGDGHYKGFYLVEDDTDLQVEIKPDGKAVLNLHYDRIEYNFKFYMYRDRGGTDPNRYSFPYNSAAGSGLDGLVTWGDTAMAQQPAWHSYHPDISADAVSSKHYTKGYDEYTDGYDYYYFALKAYYGQTIKDVWPAYNEFVYVGNNTGDREPVSYVMMEETVLKPEATGQGTDTVKGRISVLDENILGATNDADGNYVLVRFPADHYDWRYHIWFETLDADAEGAQTVGTKTYVQSETLEVRSSNTTVANQNEPNYTGYKFIGKTNQNWTVWSSPTGTGSPTSWEVNNDGMYHMNYVYDLEQYKIQFFDGTYFDGNGNILTDVTPQGILHTSDPIRMGDKIKAADIFDPTGTDYDSPEFIFGGWYTDSGCTVPYKFDTMTMGGIIVYAKWVQVQYRVFLHPNAGTSTSDPDLDWGTDEQGKTPAMNFRVSYGGIISAPTGLRPGYKFFGWYTDEDCNNVFNAADTHLTEVTVKDPPDEPGRYDYDKTEDMTDPMDKWGIIGSGDYTLGDDTVTCFNSDAYALDEDTGVLTPRDRFWITQKFDLYAKWSEVTVGAKGINVAYIAVDPDLNVTGTNAPTDTNQYMDNVDACAGAAATAPKGYAFEKWVVQKWDETKYVDTNVTVFPGETFTVLKADAKITDKNNEVVDPKNVDENGEYTYTVQLRAKYVEKEEGLPTHIVWYSNYGDENEGKGIIYRTDTLNASGQPILGINEAVVVYGLDPDTYAVDQDTLPTRNGFEFKGWTKTKGGEKADFLAFDGSVFTYAVASDTRLAVGSTVTKVAADEFKPYDDLYAVWDGKPDKLTYKANGGTGADVVTDKDANGDPYKVGDDVKPLYTVGQAGFTPPEGKTFNGWNTMANGTGTAYEPGGSYILTSEDDVLYAQWVDIPSTTGTLTITKTATGATVPPGTTFTITGPDGEKSVTYGNDFKDGVYTATNVPAGDYTVTENAASANVQGYRLTIGGDNGVAKSLAGGDTLNVKITNAYTRNGGPGPGPIPIDDPDVPLAPIPEVLNGDDHFAYVEGYPDGTVQPEGNVTRAETATMIYRLLKPVWRDIFFTDQNDFSDVEKSDWYNKAVSSMANGEYITGYPDGTFLGNNAITRAEFVTIMVRFLDMEPSDENPFTDIDNHWAKDYILIAVAAGWVDGYPDGTFDPDSNITRAEAMKIINSVLHRGVDETSDLGQPQHFFPDNSDSGKWYYYEVIEATNDHEHEGERPNENWPSNTLDYVYDIVKYERPEV